MTSSATAGTKNAADSHNMEAKGSDPLPLATLDDLLANNCSSTYDFGPASASFEDENEFLEAGIKQQRRQQQQQQQQHEQQEPLPAETKTAEATGTLDDLLAFNCPTAYDFGPASASFDEEHVEAGSAEVEAAAAAAAKSKQHGETGTSGQVVGEAEALKPKGVEQQAILERGFGYFDDAAEDQDDNGVNPIDGLFELEDEDEEEDDEEDLLANMTPISGLENLSESIVVRGVRYRPQGKPRARSSGTEKKPHSHNHNRNVALSCETGGSPPQTRHSRHRSQGAAPTPAEVRRNKARARKMATLSHSPVSRSRPIPIPDSPVLRGKLLKSKSFNGGLDMGLNDFAIGGGRAVDFDFDVHGHAQGFHDFGNSYRDHGQGFAFNMSL